MVNASEPKYSIATSDYRCVECVNEVACEATYYSAVIFGDGEFTRRNYCLDCWKRRVAQLGEGTRNESTGETGSNGSEVFASWRTRRPAAPADRPSKVRFDAGLAFEFFLRLGRAPDEPPDGAPDSDLHSDTSRQAAPEVARTDGEEERTGDSDDGGGLGSSEAARSRPSGARAGGPCGTERNQLRFFLSLLLIRKKALKFKSSIARGGEEWLLLVDRETPPRVHEVLNPGLTEYQLERLKDKLGELLQMQI